MKKTLSLVLALVMILGSFSSVFAVEPVSTEAEAGAFLKAAGVLVGDKEGNLNLKDTLLRQDTVILVAQLRGEIEAAKNFPTLPTYEDVKDPFYKAPLAWAQEKNLFVGHSEKVFGFNDNLTAQEYAKVLLCALGYKVAPNGDSDIKWADALTKAQEFGILENLKLVETDKVTRGQMALMTFNALGVNMKGSTKTLAETLKIEMPAAKELKVEVKDTENLKEIVVGLSNAKLVSKDKLEDAQNYKVSDFVVESARVDGNNVIVLLEKALVKGREYELTVRNIEKAVNGKYKFKAVDNTLPEVKEVTVLGEYGIKVTVSEPIQEPKERNFLVDGKNVTMNVENYGRDIILTPYYSSSFGSNVDKLTIKELEDFAGYKSVEKDFAIKIVKDDVAPKVEDMISRGNIVEVTFDKDIYKDSVKHYEGRADVGNISYQSGRQSIYASKAEKVATNKVKYTFDKELPRRTTLTLTDVSNHSKVKMDKVTQEPRLVLDYSEPEIISKDVETTGNTATITLKFDKEVEGDFLTKDKASDGFKVNNHFKLYERDVYRGQESVKGKIDSAKYEVKKGENVKDTIIVELSGLEEYTKSNDLNYVLEIENFTDASSLRNKMYRDYVDFKAKAETDFFVENVNVDKYSKTTEIKIKFSKSVDKALAEEFTNYLLEDNKGKIKDIKDLKGEVYAERDGKIVTIILPEDKFKVEDFATLKILNTLKDKDGTRLAHEVTYNFASGTLNGGDYTMELVSGKYEITPKKDNITLKTDKVGPFVIVGDAKKLVIDAPYAHVEIKAGVTIDEVVIKALGSSSLDINGFVKKLVVSTEKLVKVYGTIKDMQITSTVENATLELGSTNKQVIVKKGEIKEVANNDGTVTDLEKNVAAQKELDKINTSLAAIAVTVPEADAKDVAKVTKIAVDQAQALVQKGYTVTAEGETIVGNSLYIVFVLKDDKVASNTAKTLQIKYPITIK